MESCEAHLILIANPPLNKCCMKVGLNPDDVEVLCQLPPLLSKHFLSVTTIVAKVNCLPSAGCLAEKLGQSTQ